MFHCCTLTIISTVSFDTYKLYIKYIVIQEDSTNFQQKYHRSVLLIFLVIWLNNRRKGKLFLWVLKFRVVYFYSGSTGLSICADLMGRGPDPLRKIKRIIFIYTCSKVTKKRSWIISLFIYYNQKGWSRPNLSILNSSATIFRTSCKIITVTKMSVRHELLLSVCRCCTVTNFVLHQHNAQLIQTIIYLKHEMFLGQMHVNSTYIVYYSVVEYMHVVLFTIVFSLPDWYL